MKALIAFIILGLIVLTLTEINERLKAKKKPKDAPLNSKEDCETKTDGEDCSACELLSVCDKTRTK